MDVCFAGNRLQRALRQPCGMVCLSLGTLLTAGCASPGPPRAPSLGLPEPVRDLAVKRVGDTVELRFTAPSRTTDKLPLRGPTIAGQFCRQLDHQPCVPVVGSKTVVAVTGTEGHAHEVVTWTDILPADLTQGDPHLLGYRVEFFGHAGRSAGLSAPAFTADGAPPAPMESLNAQGSRLGVVLSWSPKPAAGEVVLRREDLSTSASQVAAKSSANGKSKKAPAKVEWLGTSSTASPTEGHSAQTDRTLDTTALPETPYRYVAERRIRLQLGNHAVEISSATSASVTFTLHATYPPPTPSGVTAVGYFAQGAGSPFAVDLVWQPVDEAGLIAPLAGYDVYRERVGGAEAQSRERLNAAPVRSPAFHDATADAAARYRYSITAVDVKGNESPAASVVLEDSAVPTQ